MTEPLPAPLPPAAPEASPEASPTSPRWSGSTKFLASLVFLVLVGALVSRFQLMLAPLALAFILAYLLNPLIERITAVTRMSWGLAVILVYLALLVLLLGGLVAAGIAVEQQIVGLYRDVRDFLPDLPARLESLTRQPITLGPFVLDLSKPVMFGPFRLLDLSSLDFKPLYDQLLSVLQPVLTQAGGFISSLATETASALGWLLFILIVSFYLLHDLKTVMPSLEQVLPPAYIPDMRRLVAELGPIWEAFLRGQISASLLLGLLDGVMLAMLGVRYAPALGLLAALLVFIPFVGPTLTLIVIVLVALFQPGNWLGLDPVYYLLVIAIAYTVMQQIYDNVLYPRILGRSLNLHPVIVLIGAIIGASLAGIVGLLLSAPLIATVRLFGRYAYRKTFDMDPWPEPPPSPPSKLEWPPRWLARLRTGRHVDTEKKQVASSK